MISKNNELLGFVIIFAISLSALVMILIQDPIAQEANYHLFIDRRTIWNIENFWNVVSNLPFIVVGVLGLYKLTVADSLSIIDEIKTAYIFLFLGISLVGLGSGYYHLSPNNETLLWDRLPMAVSFMVLFVIIITEFISVRAGKTFFFPLVLAGIFSVIYWHFSEAQGAGDLRFYALVQFLPMLLIPVILVCFQAKHYRAYVYWVLLLAYIVAKLLEHFDVEIYNKTLGLISGHTIKHITAAIGLYILLVSYEKRNIVKHYYTTDVNNTAAYNGIR